MKTAVGKGQKVDLTKSNPGLRELILELGWSTNQAGLELDGAAFMLQQNGKCREDQDFVFYGNPKGRAEAIEVLKADRPNQTQMKVQLGLIPQDVEKVAFTLTIYDDGQKNYKFGQVATVYLRLGNREKNNEELIYFDLSGLFTKETAVVAAELYRHQGEWKFNPVGMGYDGGLAALCGSFGLEVSGPPRTEATPPAAPAPPTSPASSATPTPTPTAAAKTSVSPDFSNPTKDASQQAPSGAGSEKVNLSKIQLKKSGEKINLSKGADKQMGEITINLNWNQKKAKSSGILGSLLGGGGAIDLDLGCFVETRNGDKTAVQALGNSFGSYDSFPYVQLDGDDRTGTVEGGENLRINGKHLAKIKRILVYTFIYEGVANWAQADGVVTIKQPDGPDIEVRLDQHDPRNKMCAIAAIENTSDGNTSIERVVRYFSGHKEMDQAFNWGFRWQAGRK